MADWHPRRATQTTKAAVKRVTSGQGPGQGSQKAP